MAIEVFTFTDGWLHQSVIEPGFMPANSSEGHAEDLPTDILLMQQPRDGGTDVMVINSSTVYGDRAYAMFVPEDDVSYSDLRNRIIKPSNAIKSFKPNQKPFMAKYIDEEGRTHQIAARYVCVSAMKPELN